MSSSDFGKVRPRERGPGFRIDARPYGWIGTLHGQTMSKRVARELLASIRRDIARGKPHADAVAPYLARNSRPQLVTEHYAAWLKVKAQEGLSPRTVQEYERYARVGGEVAWWAGMRLADVTFARLEDWMLWLAGRGLAPKTRRNVAGALRTFLEWLKDRGTIEAVPKFPRMPPVPEHDPDVVTEAQQDAILALIPDEDRGVFLVQAKMAVRPGEARALDVRALRLDLDPPMLVVSRAAKGLGPDAEIGGTKTGRNRPVNLDWRVTEWLERHPPAAEGHLFINRRTGKPWSHWTMRQRWVDAARAAGFPNVGLYEGCKHSLATNRADETKDLEAVRDVLGHSDIRSTLRYARMLAARRSTVIPTRRPGTVH